MHTSTRISADDFFYRRITHNGSERLTFTKFCPDYHELDRVAVVSPTLADGVFHTSRTLLALTTAFYDCLRSRGQPFFDYPQHFAFVGHDAVAGAQPTADRWAAWSWLDVWPEHKWVTAPPTATAMLRRVFDYQINRLFWPSGLRPLPGEEPLPDHAYRVLNTRLKAITYYSRSDYLSLTEPTLEVGGAEAVERVVQESISRLPTAPIEGRQTIASAADRLQPVPVAEFITEMHDQARANPMEDRS